jgi:putative membrane protein
MGEDPAVSRPALPSASLELAARNTSLALQRTRMGADRTLMAVIRTALALLSFGFTIFKIVQDLAAAKMLHLDSSVPHFGIGLALLGILMLTTGIIYHGQFMWRLRVIRKGLIAEGLIRGETPFPPSFTLATALILLALGVAVILSMLFRIGPFQ